MTGLHDLRQSSCLQRGFVELQKFRFWGPQLFCFSHRILHPSSYATATFFFTFKSQMYLTINSYWTVLQIYVSDSYSRLSREYVRTTWLRIQCSPVLTYLRPSICSFSLPVVTAMATTFGIFCLLHVSSLAHIMVSKSTSENLIHQLRTGKPTTPENFYTSVHNGILSRFFNFS